VTVGRQLLLDWYRRDRSIAALREHLGQTDLLPSDCNLLCAIATVDQSREAESYCRKSKRELGLAAHLTPTTVLRSLARLAAYGLAVVDTSGNRIELLVDWHAVWSLARSATPASRIERLRARATDRGQMGEELGSRESGDGEGGPGWSGVVRAGPRPRTCLRERSKIRGSGDPVSPGERVTCADERTGADRSARVACRAHAVLPPAEDTPPLTRAGSPRKPWARVGGYSDEQLVESVVSGDLDVVRHLWREALVLEWIVASEDTVVRWLTAVHHCATVDGVRNRMGLLVHLVRGGLDTSRIRHEHEDWAAEVVRAARSAGDLSERVAVCD